jgi:hypothetical protein
MALLMFDFDLGCGDFTPGTMKLWTLELWKFGTLKLWTLELWNFGTLKL